MAAGGLIEEKTEVIGAPALHEPQVTSVINDPLGVRIFEVDANLHMVPVITQLAVEHLKVSTLAG
jgi:hypothetical protein